MLVVVVAVSGVKVPVVQIIDVVAMGDRGVATVGPVHVIVLGVFDARVRVASVPMVVVSMMEVAVVDVVDVVAVGHGHVPAVGTMDVGMFRVGSMLHGTSMSFVSDPGSSFPTAMGSNGSWVVCNS